MKMLSIVLLALMLCGATAAQAVKGSDAKMGLVPGTVYGEIVIKEKSGTGMAGFACLNLHVYVSAVRGAWKRRVRASGDSPPTVFVQGDERAVGHAVRRSAQSRLSKVCDQGTSDTTTSFQMKLKGAEKLRYDFTVSKIGCVLLK